MYKVLSLNSLPWRSVASCSHRANAASSGASEAVELKGFVGTHDYLTAGQVIRKYKVDLHLKIVAVHKHVKD